MSLGINREGADFGGAKADSEVSGLSLGELYGVLVEQKWLIASVFAASIIAGALFNSIRSPQYRADGILQVEEKTTGLSVLKELQPLLGGDENSVSAEIEILSSRMVLGKVVEKLKLDQSVTPIDFPVLRAMLGNRKGDEGSFLDDLLKKSLSWAGESIKVESLVVPDAYLDKPLRILVKQDGSFQLEDFNGGFVGSGRVGERLKTEKVELFVSQAKELKELMT